MSESVSPEPITPPKPKVFISYSWTSSEHQSRVVNWATRLMADGINVILDVWDLKEGHDKFHFMEKMVNDPDVTKVLILSDAKYANRADSRTAGVGAESQLISKEIYERIDQTKFIPIVCEYHENKACLPAFLSNRIWINFSSDQKVNENWEQLVRSIFGKPLFQKPEVGAPPLYIQDDKKAPSNPALAKLETMKQAAQQGRTGIERYRKDFLNSSLGMSDALRPRTAPEDFSEEYIVEKFRELTVVRSLLVDWVFVELDFVKSEKLGDILAEVFETLLEQRSKPKEISSWTEAWYLSHQIFALETFLYVVAALLKNGEYALLHEVFTSQYLSSESRERFSSYDGFYTHAQLDKAVATPNGGRYYSCVAELFKRSADRDDIRFRNLIEADLLCYLMALLQPNVRWYPQLAYYIEYGDALPFFIRLAQRRHFAKLATITGVSSGDELRKLIQASSETNKLRNSDLSDSLVSALRMEKWDTL